MFHFPDYTAVLHVVPIAAAVAFLVCICICPVYIGWLKKKQIGQYIREEGPQSHASKAKTPTMGGVAFIVAIWLAFPVMLLIQTHLTDISSRLVTWFTPLACATACALIGVADDYGKVTSKSNRGLSAKFRLIVEFITGGALALALGFIVPGFAGVFNEIPELPFGSIILNQNHPPKTEARESSTQDQPSTTSVESASQANPSGAPTGPAPQPVNSIRLTEGLLWAYGILFVPFVFAGTANSLNLHDGMDGLASGTSLLVFATLGVMLVLCGYVELAMLAGCASGALAGFLVFNKYPAKVFMGDTGSLFLGGLLASLAITSGLVLWLVPLALIYVVEAVSVMAQVVVFKLTKPYTPDKPMSSLALIKLKLTKKLPGEGKRLLRMAPIHHHFEAVAAERGIKEWQVVVGFWLAQLLLCLAVLAVFMS